MSGEAQAQATEMTFYIVEDGELIKYERRGGCLKCGQCCCTRRITFRGGAYTENTGVEENEKDDYDWSDYEGFSIFRSQDMLWYLEAQAEEEIATCAEYQDGKCAIWMQEDFPAICRYWPVHPDNLKEFPGCGFSFERIGK